MVEAVEVIIIHVGSLGITRGYDRCIEAGAPYLDSMIPDAPRQWQNWLDRLELSLCWVGAWDNPWVQWESVPLQGGTPKVVKLVKVL